jgi:hypothetical protein
MDMTPLSVLISLIHTSTCVLAAKGDLRVNEKLDNLEIKTLISLGK